jgi:hypothetical protein
MIGSLRPIAFFEICIYLPKGLVACGHTIGGVHQVDFPLSVEGAITSSNPDGVVHFDSTFDSFDNRMFVALHFFPFPIN